MVRGPGVAASSSKGPRLCVRLDDNPNPVLLVLVEALGAVLAGAWLAADIMVRAQVKGGALQHAALGLDGLGGARVGQAGSKGKGGAVPGRMGMDGPGSVTVFLSVPQRYTVWWWLCGCASHSPCPLPCTPASSCSLPASSCPPPTHTHVHTLLPLTFPLTEVCCLCASVLRSQPPLSPPPPLLASPCATGVPPLHHHGPSSSVCRRSCCEGSQCPWVRSGRLRPSPSAPSGGGGRHTTQAVHQQCVGWHAGHLPPSRLRKPHYLCVHERLGAAGDGPTWYGWPGEGCEQPEGSLVMCEAGRHPLRCIFSYLK
jgi:hypothetical protein